MSSPPEALRADQVGFNSSIIEQELDQKFPNRPRNHGPTLPFHALHLTLFHPLNANVKRSNGSKVVPRRRTGPDIASKIRPQEIRRQVIERFITRWRKETGNDIYPAFRLIVPEKDRERAMYGLKEKVIGKLLVRVTGINLSSDDAATVLNWKLPGTTVASRLAGDFAGRCYELLMKRPMRTEVGDMTIGEVNEMLDRLAGAQKEKDQIPIFQAFYSRMNPDELMWLIRIILRQMKVGATERTFFEIWHPDAANLFNVSSSLKRVCWELWDPNFRLDGAERGVALMQCFQPQLAQFQMHSFAKMVEKMGGTADDPYFWIEEKLDGERMQMHMMSDNDTPGGKRFCFWSRKAKDYTYLYGNGFYDNTSALTRFLTKAFHPGVESIILDGEMITWDMDFDTMVPFGTLKTAALSEQRHVDSSTGQRPLLRVFDILHLNGVDLTHYELRKRREALEKSIIPNSSTHRRLEIHERLEASDVSEVDNMLRKVVAEASEGLVLKNPRSQYCLNERNDDWMKVKPEYMTEFGESLDCLIIGGHYGSGRRGGTLSSFICGLRVTGNHAREENGKFMSFFSVGGGFTVGDYQSIRHKTEGKWIDWKKDSSWTSYMDFTVDTPDVWIKPQDSIVLSVKAASVQLTGSYKVGLTLRFPRFKKIREDRGWDTALTIQEFLDLKSSAEKEKKEKEFQVDTGRRKVLKRSKQKPVTVAGDEDEIAPYGGPKTAVFDGMTFFIMSESLKPERKTKAELEQMVKENGGRIIQTHDAVEHTILIADKRLVKVMARINDGNLSIIRPLWLFDCIKQIETDVGKQRLLLPLEPRHMLFMTEESMDEVEGNVDLYQDAYARLITSEELREIIDHMPTKKEADFDAVSFRQELQEYGCNLDDGLASMFQGLIIYMDDSRFYAKGNCRESKEDLRFQMASFTVRFAGAIVTTDLEDQHITHVIVGLDRKRISKVRGLLASRSIQPRIVTQDWIERSWKEGTMLDEERFAPI